MLTIARFLAEPDALQRADTRDAWRALCAFLDEHPIPGVHLEVDFDPRVSAQAMSRIAKGQSKSSANPQADA